MFIHFVHPFGHEDVFALHGHGSSIKGMISHYNDISYYFNELVFRISKEKNHAMQKRFYCLVEVNKGLIAYVCDRNMERRDGMR